MSRHFSKTGRNRCKNLRSPAMFLTVCSRFNFTRYCFCHIIISRIKIRLRRIITPKFTKFISEAYFSCTLHSVTVPNQRLQHRLQGRYSQATAYLHLISKAPSCSTKGETYYKTSNEQSNSSVRNALLLQHTL